MNLAARAVLALLLAASLAAAWRIGCRLVAEEIAHRQPDIEGLQAALSWNSTNADVSARLGRRYGDIPGQLDLAIQHTERAVELVPYDWRSRAQLAQFHEFSGDRQKAEQALLAAVELGPKYPAYQWRLANFYLRAGREEEFWEPAGKALAGDISLLPAAFPLMIRIEGTAEQIHAVWPSDRYSNHRLLSLLYFLGPERVRAAYTSLLVDRWQEVLREDPLPTGEEARVFFDTLLRSEQFDLAREQWIELASAKSQPDRGYLSGANLLWNGSFDLPLADTGLGWRTPRTEGAEVQQEHSNGRSSLVIHFEENQSSKKPILSQRVVVRPGVTYDFYYEVRSNGFNGEVGPFFEILDPVQRSKVHTTADIVGTARWRPRLTSFTVGPDTNLLVLQLRGEHLRTAESEEIGVLWLDHLVLREAENANESF